MMSPLSPFSSASPPSRLYRCLFGLISTVVFSVCCFLSLLVDGYLSLTEQVFHLVFTICLTEPFSPGEGVVFYSGPAFLRHIALTAIPQGCMLAHGAWMLQLSREPWEALQQWDAESVFQMLSAHNDNRRKQQPVTMLHARLH